MRRRGASAFARLRESAAGHVWTYAGFVAGVIAPPRAVDDVPFRTEVPDPALGSIPVRGRLAARGDERLLVVVLHGLGGTLESRYMREATHAARAAGHAVLRLSLRGADGGGTDVYHAGLHDDLHAALASPALAGFSAIALLGYSLGGHVVLRALVDAAHRPLNPRVVAAAAVCAPLDLGACSYAIARADRRPYESHVLRGLVAQHEAVAARRGFPEAQRVAVRGVRSIRAWDALVVCPRFGFASVDAYHEAMSVGPHLGRVRLPTLVVHADADPMVPTATVSRFLARTPWVEPVVLRRGGHVFFPRGALVAGPLAAHGGPGLSVDARVVAWLAAAGARAAEVR